jgi:hypothetical protein
MKKLVITGLTAAAIVGSVASAGTASADADGFLNYLHSQGWIGSEGGDYRLMRLGLEVCEVIKSGGDGYQAAAVTYANTDDSVDRLNAADFTIAAVRHLCPQFYNSGSGDANNALT